MVTYAEFEKKMFSIFQFWASLTKKRLRADPSYQSTLSFHLPTNNRFEILVVIIDKMIEQTLGLRNTFACFQTPPMVLPAFKGDFLTDF